MNSQLSFHEEVLLKASNAELCLVWLDQVCLIIQDKWSLDQTYFITVITLERNSRRLQLSKIDARKQLNNITKLGEFPVFTTSSSILLTQYFKKQTSRFLKTFDTTGEGKVHIEMAMDRLGHITGCSSQGGEPHKFQKCNPNQILVILV